MHEQLKEKLLKEKEDLDILMRELMAEEKDIKEDHQETSADVSDVAEQFEEKQSVFSQKELVHNRLLKISKALLRLEAGQYGLCTKCGQPIEEMRLKIDPATETCRKCSLG